MVIRFVILVCCCVISFVHTGLGDTKAPKLRYSINCKDLSGDTFKVTLKVQGLKPENAVYQFASTAPGTYQVMDAGRYVRSFRALDAKGKDVFCEKISVNQWKIHAISTVSEIRYDIADTWDSVVKENYIYEMCGSSLEKDHALINPHTVIGYPTGMQQEALSISIQKPSEWLVGTALEQNTQGEFVAKNYDHAVDSPILLGRLTKAQTDIKGSTVEIYTYSKTDKISSTQLLGAMKEMLNAAGEFMRELPVKRYTFLYHFENKSIGAWEHSYSSEYVFEEQDYTPAFGQHIKDVSAHEFFHVITPLNIHSEIIERFNFVTPTPSDHLWLYEGVTEWAAHIMQLRAGLTNLQQYFTAMSQKVMLDNRYFDRSYSLLQLARTTYSPTGQRQYGNIYMRGALVAGLLDIRLLELSGGKKGLREVVLDLAKKYGPSKPFTEKKFFEELVMITYPEINTFVEDYIKNAQPLPLREYYEKIGITYYESKQTGAETTEFGVLLSVDSTNTLKIDDYKIALDTCGIKVGDKIIAINDMKITSQQQLAPLRAKMKVGEIYTMKVERSGQELLLKLPLLARKVEQPYYFEVNTNPLKKQMVLREQWMKNFK